MKSPPPGWPRLSSALFYSDASKAIDWLTRAFGFETRLKIEGDAGQIVHSELTFGEALVMVASSRAEENAKSPREIGGANTQSLFLYVDDVEAHCARARAAGGKIVKDPETKDYGEEYWSDRTYQVEDPEGHRWWFGQRMSTGGKKEEAFHGAESAEGHAADHPVSVVQGCSRRDRLPVQRVRLHRALPLPDAGRAHRPRRARLPRQRGHARLGVRGLRGEPARPAHDPRAGVLLRGRRRRALRAREGGRRDHHGRARERARKPDV